jgi:actin-related protein
MGTSLIFGSENLTADKPNTECSIIDLENKENLEQGENFIEFYSNYFCKKLALDPKEHPVIISEPDCTSETFRKTISALVESVEIPKFFLVKKSALTLYSCGKTSGAVLDSGGFYTHITPVEEGYPHSVSHVKSRYAGTGLTLKISEQISFDKLKKIYSLNSPLEKYSESYLDFLKCELAEKAKKQLFKFENST